MNVYDFDKTILRGDSTKAFYAWCVAHHPKIVRHWPRLAVDWVRWKSGCIDKTAFKERLFVFLADLPDVTADVSRFWRWREHALYGWYLARKQPDDIIISASPEFLLTPICQRLGVTLIASLVDPRTGRYSGLNCYGEEKPKRFRALYPHAVIDEFYTDSRTDAPMAALAKRAYYVQQGVPRDW